MASIEKGVKFGRVPEKGLGKYQRSRIRVSTEEVESGRVLKKGKIRSSTEEVESRQVSKKGKIRTSIREGPGEYRKRVWASTGEPKKTSQAQQHKERGCMP